MKRDLYVCEKRPYAYGKRSIKYICGTFFWALATPRHRQGQKPQNTSKETYVYMKRDLNVYEK